MKQIKKQMIREFNMKNFDCDMMGYFKQKGDQFEAHHLIIPKRDEGKLTRLNTAVLYTTSHEYLHIIEDLEFELFGFITSEMIDMNIKGFLDRKNLIYIDDCLDYFERKYYYEKTKNGKPIIKEKYLQRHDFML